ncbi:precorrin-3B synthase [Streptomyces sp. NPDC002889]|uniref:precorrin-3B synthase n=1 Tax=Streptomyces sp. NPDC002889 TaxID=3364669 RepID=UPI0036AD19A6
MPPAPSNHPNAGEPPIRDRGDACPGALRLHAADDGALARVRIPAGVLSAAQAYALADAAERLGDSALDITSRGNLQLRGLDGSCGGELAAVLGAAGLLPAPRHERIRNVVASPLSGLDEAGHLDVQPLVRQLDALLCSSERAASLSGRFLFALDDGRGDLAGLGADVMLLAEPDGQVRIRLAGGEQGLRVPAHEGARTLLLAAEAFLDAVDASGTRAWRVRELPPEHAVSAGELARRAARAGIAARIVTLGAGAHPGGRAGAASAEGDNPREADAVPAFVGTALSATGDAGEVAAMQATGGEGIAGQTEPAAADDGGAVPAAGPVPGVVLGADTATLCVLAPLGRLTVIQWRLLADLAGRHGSGELRVTPWRGVVVPHLPVRTAARELHALAGAGLITDPASPWLGVGACTGRPGCAKALSDVRADATAMVRATGPGGLPVYWSGCERRCGHPQGAWVDAVATGDGYDLSVRGARGSRPPARHGVPTARLADALLAARGTSSTDSHRPTK